MTLVTCTLSLPGSIIANTETSWVRQPLGLNASLSCIKAVSQSVCWAAGGAGTVIRTTDGGATWTSVGGGALGTQDIYAMDAIDRNLGIVTTTPATTTFIHRTTNGGATWTQVYAQSGGFINALHMFDATVGIAIGDPVSIRWTVTKTTNGGFTWTRISTEPVQIGTEGGWIGSAAFFPPGYIWFGTNSNRLYRSTDLGATWSSSTVGVTNIYSLFFTSPLIGLAAGSGAARTSDGGATWTPVTVPGTGNINSVTGVVVTLEFWCTKNTAIYHSPNHGTSWTNAPPNGYPGGAAAISMATIGQNVFGWALVSTAPLEVLRYRRIVTDVSKMNNATPTGFVLIQNYPNPLQPDNEHLLRVADTGHRAAEDIQFARAGSDNARRRSTAGWVLFRYLDRQQRCRLPGVKWRVRVSA
ncbi:MAG: hypothetical protein AAB393_00675 [Bacteroidota bacterium]